jgi:hypothetical protein
MRMNPTQFHALSTADPDTGKLAYVDRRTVNGLVRRGWAEKRAHRPKGRRREVVEWFRTDAGAYALAVADVVEPPARPDWRDWEVATVRRGVEFVANGHTVVKQPGGCGWRVDCPDRPGRSVGVAETLAEALDLLAPHLFVRSCGPVPVDLDAITLAG